ncbi:DUF5990 family protein [Streptomyces sp. SPB162]|uniref:DUF5990 family protein n=1 Tax=Streptomyces sp. SPB162 TaxID=2940560 RepID=UPI002405934D|nr:DUF5990 family protein [Streptomyces sp. SPB162]MDF9811517.1 hypothetical protein [Streptomyces sp. SPB162]
MEIRIEATDLPGRAVAPGPDFPAAQAVHIGVQRKDRAGEWTGLHPGDAASARWTLEAVAAATATGTALEGPYIQDRLGGRFVFLAWVTVDAASGVTDMLRRAKLMFADIPPETLAAAVRGGRLTARLRLTTPEGRPLCGRVRPPLVTWSARDDGA